MTTFDFGVGEDADGAMAQWLGSTAHEYWEMVEEEETAKLDAETATMDVAAAVVFDSELKSDLLAQARWLASAGLTHASAAVARLAHENWLHEVFEMFHGKPQRRRSKPIDIARVLIKKGAIEDDASVERARTRLCRAVHGLKVEVPELRELISIIADVIDKPLSFPPRECTKCGATTTVVSYRKTVRHRWRCSRCELAKQRRRLSNGAQRRPQVPRETRTLSARAARIERYRQRLKEGRDVFA